MSNAHKGVVPLEIAGRTIPLRFTWERIGQIGRDALTAKLHTATMGEPGDGKALADLIELASGGEVAATDLLASSEGVERAIVALHEAWALARFGPARQPIGGAANPLSRPWTSWKTLWGRFFRPG